VHGILKQGNHKQLIPMSFNTPEIKTEIVYFYAMNKCYTWVVNAAQANAAKPWHISLKKSLCNRMIANLKKRKNGKHQPATAGIWQ
jgi:hypothetical protein